MQFKWPKMLAMPEMPECEFEESITKAQGDTIIELLRDIKNLLKSIKNPSPFIGGD